MAKNKVFYARYEPPEIPPGRLRMGDNFSIKFPIQEKSAEGFIGQLNILIEEVYQRGVKDGAKFEHSDPDDSPPVTKDERRIKRAKVGHDCSITVASTYSDVLGPQCFYLENNEDAELVCRQINKMIEEAEERGYDKGIEDTECGEW